MDIRCIATAADAGPIPVTPNRPPSAPPRFPRGRLVMTANAARRIPWDVLKDGLRRHETGDWGELDPLDIRANEVALKHGGRLLSAYGRDDGRFWIITEADRTVTTILLPEDH